MVVFRKLTEVFSVEHLQEAASDLFRIGAGH